MTKICKHLTILVWVCDCVVIFRISKINTIIFRSDRNDGFWILQKWLKVKKVDQNGANPKIGKIAGPPKIDQKMRPKMERSGKSFLKISEKFLIWLSLEAAEPKVYIMMNILRLCKSFRTSKMIIFQSDRNDRFWILQKWLKVKKVDQNGDPQIGKLIKKRSKNEDREMERSGKSSLKISKKFLVWLCRSPKVYHDEYNNNEDPYLNQNNNNNEDPYLVKHYVSEHQGW